MKLIIRNGTPAHMDVAEATPQEVVDLRRLLTYRDRSVEFLLARHKKNKRWAE